MVSDTFSSPTPLAPQAFAVNTVEAAIHREAQRAIA